VTGAPPNGLILYPKPAGVTSHDCVAEVRRRMPRKTRVGHAGTLDPFATGLLLIPVGRMTRAQRFLMALPKTYRTVARLGWRSDTGDRDGTLEQTERIPADPQIPVGDLMQRPPAFSAVRVGGERLYEKARRGELEEGEPRPVTVHRAERLWLEGDRAGFEIQVSSGTYIRQLVADLSDAYCDELERTAIGPFDLSQADPERIVAPYEALGFMPVRVLDDSEATAVSNGVAVPVADLAADGPVRMAHGDRVVAIGERRDHELQPVVVFAS
jgi:tRNA pseudouridine55 synthase